MVILGNLRKGVLIVKFAAPSPMDLAVGNNLFAMVILMAKAALARKDFIDGKERDALLLKLKLELARQLLAKQIAKEKIRVLMNFLRYYIRFENPAINAKFEQEVEILTERGTTMGIEELLLDRATKQGLEKGKKEEAVAIAREMKKDGVAIEQIAKFTKLSIADIEKL